MWSSKRRLVVFMTRRALALILCFSAVRPTTRLNNIPEAQMKHFFHSGCLLRSVFEVELKMSSFLLKRNVPRDENGIQIQSKEEKMKWAGIRLSIQMVIFACQLYSNLRGDIASTHSSYELHRARDQAPFQIKIACCWHQQGHYLFISLRLLL